MLGYGRDESAPTPCGVFVGCFVVCSQRYWQPISSCRGIFIVPAYTYSPRIRKLFEMYSRSVRNVFIICMLHNRHSKVWFLQCKSMVFGVQKGGFYNAKVWFL